MTDKDEQKRIEQIIYDDEHDADFNEIYNRMTDTIFEQNKVIAISEFKRLSELDKGKLQGMVFVNINGVDGPNVASFFNGRFVKFHK